MTGTCTKMRGHERGTCEDRARRSMHDARVRAGRQRHTKRGTGRRQAELRPGVASGDQPSPALECHPLAEHRCCRTQGSWTTIPAHPAPSSWKLCPATPAKGNHEPPAPRRQARAPGRSAAPPLARGACSEPLPKMDRKKKKMARRSQRLWITLTLHFAFCWLCRATVSKPRHGTPSILPALQAQSSAGRAAVAGDSSHLVSAGRVGVVRRRVLRDNI